MSTSKAFIFSLDAFVAFTLALVAIYSLIFFSSIPSAHYAALLQAHTLGSDAMVALAKTDYYGENISMLDYVLLRGSDDKRREKIYDYIGKNIPDQFGYKVALSEDGEDWGVLYDTSSGNKDVRDNHHNTEQKRLSISTYSIVMEYEAEYLDPENPYGYWNYRDEVHKFYTGTCSGLATPCNPLGNQTGLIPEPTVRLVRLTNYLCD